MVHDPCLRCVSSESAGKDEQDPLRWALLVHDLANLVSAIAGHAELLSASSTDEDVAAIREAARRATQLVVEMRGVASEAADETSHCDVAVVLMRARRIVEVVVGSEVEVSLACALTRRVRLASDDLLDIVLNAAVNARDAMPHGGRLLVSAECAPVDRTRAERMGIAPGPYGVLRIQDTGIGMDELTLARAFEPFFTTKGVGGSGLGLSSVRSKLVDIGGAAECTSELGVGTCLTLYVPLVERLTAPPCAAPPETPVRT